MMDSHQDTLEKLAELLALKENARKIVGEPLDIAFDVALIALMGEEDGLTFTEAVDAFYAAKDTLVEDMAEMEQAVNNAKN